jgi:hypothetical protein
MTALKDVSMSTINLTDHYDNDHLKLDKSLVTNILSYSIFVTKIIRPTIRLPAINVNDRTVHLEASLLQ